jgi:hypothetical protein
VLNNIPDSLSRYPVGGPVHLNLEGEDCRGLDGLAEERGSGGPRLESEVQKVEGKDCRGLDGLAVERGSRGPMLGSEVQKVVCTGEFRPITEWAAVEQFA